MTTIKEIAKDAGVSVATVSHVINNTRYVTEETTNKVLDAMKRLDYQPNAVARSLRTRKTNIVALVIPDIINPYFSEVCRGFQDVAEKEDYVVVVCNSDRNYDNEKRIINVLRQQQVEGIVLNASKIGKTDLNLLLGKETPLVLLGNFLEESSFNRVMIDNIKAAYDAVSYLISLGCSDIACINGELDSSSGEKRFSGYQKAMRDHDLQINEEFISHGNFTYESGYQQFKEMLKNSTKKPEALFATSDTLALGAMFAAAEMNISVPDEISIMGFDDIPEAQRVIPKLTTIHQPKYETGVEAAKLLFRSIQDKDTSEKIILEHELIVRESTRQ